MYAYRVATVLEYAGDKVPVGAAAPTKAVTGVIAEWVERGWELFAIQSIDAPDYYLNFALTFRKVAD